MPPVDPLACTVSWCTARARTTFVVESETLARLGFERSPATIVAPVCHGCYLRLMLVVLERAKLPRAVVNPLPPPTVLREIGPLLARPVAEAIEAKK